MKKSLLFILLMFMVAHLNGQKVLINEIMAINNNTLSDKDGDYPDWIELYNGEDYPINLKGYRLSDDFNKLDKWIFPEIHILPHSYLIIFTSGKNRLDTNELHTNFKISSDGEALYLSGPSGGIVDQTSAIKLSNEESYARFPDGGSEWIVIYTPTPNRSNNDSNLVQFSRPSGIYRSPFWLKIQSLQSDTLYYTLNGDIPSLNDNIVTDSLFIGFRENDPNMFSEIPTSPEQDLISYKAWESPASNQNKATVLRCASYSNGERTSKLYTNTYLVDPEGNRKYTLPVISLVSEQKNLFDHDTGIYVPGIYYDTDNPEWTGNYFAVGPEWEREVHIQYFDNNGNSVFSQDAGIRINGGKTRHAAQKSLRLYAREEYGKQYFNFPLLPNRQVDEYKRIVLRTTMGAWTGQTILNDILVHDISSSLNVDYQDFQPAIVYLNGEYWGIHTLRDRIDERYLAYTHQLDKDSVIIREWKSEDFKELTQFIENNDLSINHNYDYVNTQIDIDNFIDYLIIEMFFANLDWPQNNLKIWKKIPDGKWRWILYDMDACFKNVDYDIFNHSAMTDHSTSWPNTPLTTYLFRHLLKNEIFEKRFIERCATILNEVFDVDLLAHRLETIKDMYSPEIRDHIDRWNYPDSYGSWEDDIEKYLLSFLLERPCVVRNQIMSFFELTYFGFDCGNKEKGSIHFILASNPNDGYFFITNEASDVINARITIFDTNGKMVLRENGIHLKRNEKKYFDLPNAENGIYFMQVQTYKYSVVKKFVIIN